MTISDLKYKHLEGIVELEGLCFSLPWTYSQLEHQMLEKNSVFLVAENEKGDILGYIGMMFVLDEGYIFNVAVSPNCRLQGVAGALLDALEGRSKEKNLSFITLEVRESNFPAISLYSKHGFTAVGTRPNYYQQPKENALLMTKFFNK